MTIGFVGKLLAVMRLLPQMNQSSLKVLSAVSSDFMRRPRVAVACSPSLMLETPKIKRLVPALLKWFATTARPLPWRQTRDPYAIWVSEIMLQQTQVKTVIPYWERWLGALPTIQSLADADAATIHKLWEGLGYYTRVRNLQKAARQIMSQHGGEFPRQPALILELPGIGPYTAGAIASIAFNEPQPILDGNVIRVLTRLFAIAENPREKKTNQKLWSIANDLVTTAASLQLETENLKLETCSALNQSLMELGALICLPRQPQCPRCPVRSHCRAYKMGKPEAFPNLAPRPAVTQLRQLAFVIQYRDRYLVRQRPAGQVNAHLWEFPNVQFLAANKHSLPSAKITGLVHDTLGLEVKNPVSLCTIKHSITRYRITLQVFRMIATHVPKRSKNQWLTLPQLNALAFTSAHRKILARLEQ